MRSQTITLCSTIRDRSTYFTPITTKTLEIDASTLTICIDQWHDCQFSELLAHSACALQELYIKNVNFPTGEFFRCFDLSNLKQCGGRAVSN
jgi:hypothetical protein